MDTAEPNTILVDWFLGSAILEDSYQQFETLRDWNKNNRVWSHQFKLCHHISFLDKSGRGQKDFLFYQISRSHNSWKTYHGANLSKARNYSKLSTALRQPIRWCFVATQAIQVASFYKLCVKTAAKRLAGFPHLVTLRLKMHFLRASSAILLHKSLTWFVSQVY